MKKLVGSVFSILVLSSIAMAETYTTYVCSPPPLKPGGSTYLLILQNTPPGFQSRASILERAVSNGKSTWTYVTRDASAHQALDGGPLTIRYEDENRDIDWSNPAISNHCFLNLKKGYSFVLTNGPKGIEGNLRTFARFAGSPKKQCPTPFPPAPHSEELVCEAQ